MERIPIPTAPGERAKWQNPQPKRIGWLVLTLLLSLGTGFSGALLAKVYQFDMLTPTTPDIIVVPENTTTGSASVVRSLQSEQSEALVLVKQSEQVVGTGVVLSSDGWIVTLSKYVVGQTVVSIETSDGRTEDSDAIAIDEVTGLAYIHINQSGLRVAQFRTDPVVLGENMVAYARTAAGDHAAFATVSFVTEDTDETLSLDRVLSSVFEGAPLYDSDFTVVGFATDTASVIPISAVNDVAYGLFTTGEIIHDADSL